MKNILERLNEDILVCEGAMGTMLMAKGMPKGVCPESWAIENENILLSVHKEYVESGADIIIANTFGANGIKLKKFDLQEKGPDINRKAVDIARKAASDKAYVFGDIGPTGGYIKPVGDIEPEEMLKVFAEQVKVLSAAGCDAIILETISDLEELKTAIIAVKENSKLPLISSMTFGKTESKGFRTTSGISIPQFVNDSLLSGSDVIGVNCTITIADMVELIAEIKKLCSSFIIAQPNAGMPKLIDGNTIYEQSVDEYIKHVPKLIEAGVNIIGGCCGTTPEYIRKIKEIVIDQA